MDLTTIKDFLDPAMRGSRPARRNRERARREWHQARFTAQVMSSGMDEIPRSDLAPLLLELTAR